MKGKGKINYHTFCVSSVTGVFLHTACQTFHRDSLWQTQISGSLLSAGNRFRKEIKLPVSNVFLHASYTRGGGGGISYALA